MTKKEIKDTMDALENNELKNDGFWGRACSRLSQQLQTAKEENEKLNKLHAFLHNKFNWSKEDVWIRNYLSSYIFDEEMVSDGKEYISPLKQILDLTQQNKQLETEKLRMQTALDKIRDIELASLDVDWDEYKAECGTTDFSAIVTNCEIGLRETEE